MNMKEKMKVEVDGVIQEREVDFYTPRRIFDGDRYKTIQFPIPMINPKKEYIYENNDGLKIYSKGIIHTL